MKKSKRVSQYIQFYSALTSELQQEFCASASVTQNLAKDTSQPIPPWSMQEVTHPVRPFFMDLEITTACQLRCCYCARTFLDVTTQHMNLATVEKVLEAVPTVVAVNLVGLGEPLLHPELKEIIRLLKTRGIRTSLVTNGMALDEKMVRILLESGLDALTFSLDSVDHNVLRRHRAGIDPGRILTNIEHFMNVVTESTSAITVNLFSVLQEDTLPGLGKLAQFAASVKIPAIVISELNFEENAENVLRNKNRRDEILIQLLDQMRQVASCGVVLLGPNLLDCVNMAIDWPMARIRRPEQLLRDESSTHKNCLAPWRTLVVRVDGNIDFCNCTPGRSAGNILQQSLEKVWHSLHFQEFRKTLHDGPVERCCAVCPRL